MEILGKKLSGNFVLDTGTEHSLVSPFWLKNQGVPLGLLRIFPDDFKTISWNGIVKSARKVYSKSSNKI